MSKAAFDKIAEGLTEALEIAKPARAPSEEDEETYQLTAGALALMRAGIAVADLGRHPALITAINEVCEERAAHRLSTALDEEAMPVSEFLECAQYDALMEGPRFRGWNRSALDRLRQKCEAIMGAPPAQNGDA